MEYEKIYQKLSIRQNGLVIQKKKIHGNCKKIQQKILVIQFNNIIQMNFIKNLKVLSSNTKKLKEIQRQINLFKLLENLKLIFQKNKFVCSSLINKSEAPLNLLQEFYCKYKDQIGYNQYNNEQIGCILEYYQKQSYVVLLESKGRTFINNTIIIDKQPELLLDYFENMNWITIVERLFFIIYLMFEYQT
ncbi:unnamed protein product [Paramecium primaurelia]|uniref:Uncharacterized protein n=1 Tax=Paramecium primaurelia TaxID=5886 RepID=A0A8S1L8N1_PARPR|nr:unnamed protein product [Paramecium primaurelia]